MKKIVLVLLTALSLNAAFAQMDSLPPKKKTTIDLSGRPGDHFMIQMSSDTWLSQPDSIKSHQSGFSKGFNAYIMLDKPFKGSPNFSVALGIGLGTSNISFKKMNIDVKSLATKMPFTAADSSNHFKKYKVSLSYAEIPLELRYSSNPSDPNKSWKIAIGGKVGSLINAHTKGKNLENNNNTVINSYVEKENSRKFFNGTRLMGTARVGYGILSVFANYEVNNVLKDGVGPPMKTLQLGIAISGL